MKRPSSSTGNKQKFVSEAGNLFHLWRDVDWPFEVNKLAKEAEQKERLASEEPALFPEIIPAIATGISVTEHLLDEARIENARINWVDQWTKESYTAIGIHEDEETSQSKEVLFEQLDPLEEAVDNYNYEDMQESNFLKWLKSKQSGQQEFEKLVTLEEEEVKKETTTDQVAPSSADKRKLSKKEKKKQLKKILKKSLEIEDEIVSETLAKVMVQQGHISKARKMYEKLSLIFPEKSAYFADIIENLEEE